MVSNCWAESHHRGWARRDKYHTLWLGTQAERRQVPPLYIETQGPSKPLCDSGPRERKITHPCSWGRGEVVLLALRNPGCSAKAGIMDVKTFRDEAIEQWGQWRWAALSGAQGGDV